MNSQPPTAPQSPGNHGAFTQFRVENLDAMARLAERLATGLQSVMRRDMEFHYWTTSIIARDYYDLRNVDPRYTGELLGAGTGACVFIASSASMPW